MIFTFYKILLDFREFYVKQKLKIFGCFNHTITFSIIYHTHYNQIISQKLLKVIFGYNQI
jgi:hypothetical protein